MANIDEDISAPIELSAADAATLIGALKEYKNPALEDDIARMLRRLEGVCMMLGGMQGLRDDIRSGKINLKDYK